MTKLRASLLVILAVLAVYYIATRPAPPTNKIRLERVLESHEFKKALWFGHAGDDRIFVVEQTGVIKVVSDGKMEVFLDISERVAGSGEKGLLGLAFHPQFAENNEFYLYYSTNQPHHSVVARFQAKDGKGLPDSEERLMMFQQPFSNHNGGHIAFGPDGFLYIGVGDGGSGGDPRGHAQNRRTVLGSILRIDVNYRPDPQVATDPLLITDLEKLPEPDAVTPPRPYAIPPDNPFVGNTEGFAEELYAYGLRNPWRYSFDSKTGDLWAGDVGQGKVEEIDIIVNGGNYGWNYFEGDKPFKGEPGDQKFVEPVVAYSHRFGRSVTGGRVYRGPSIPSQVGRYLYADFGSGYIWSATREENELILETDKNISTFGVDNKGELYVVHYPGEIYRIVAEEK